MAHILFLLYSTAVDLWLYEACEHTDKLDALIILPLFFSENNYNMLVFEFHVYSDLAL